MLAPYWALSTSDSASLLYTYAEKKQKEQIVIFLYFNRIVRLSANTLRTLSEYGKLTDQRI